MTSTKHCCTVSSPTGFRFPQRGVLLSLGPVTDKYWFADEAKVIAEELRLPIYATHGTADMLSVIGIACTAVEKRDGDRLSAIALIYQGDVSLALNPPPDSHTVSLP